MTLDISIIVKMLRSGECTEQQASEWIAGKMKNNDLRDLFAGHALQSILAAMKINLTDPSEQCERYARVAYRMADQMMKVRGKA